MNCLIIDSDKESSKPLEKVIKKSPHLKLVANCVSAAQASEIISRNRIDLIFIEGQVQCQESAEFLDYIEVNKPQVIAVSSVTEVSKVKFNFTIADFILKPVSNVQLNRVVNKIILEQTQHLEIGAADAFIFIKANRTFHKVATADIIYVQALSDYVRIHTSSKVYTTYSTMKEMANKLPQKDFLRIHRSYIVRVDRISQFQEGFLSVDKRLLPIGKLYKQQLLDRLNIVR